jgi:hypothetical protein
MRHEGHIAFMTLKRSGSAGAMTGKRPVQFMAAQAAQSERLVAHTESWKITVIILERHAGYLDGMRAMIRMRHYKAVSRGEIIRAFVEFMNRSEIDFTQFASMEAMVAYLTEYFSRNPNRGRLPWLLESSPPLKCDCEEPQMAASP